MTLPEVSLHPSLLNDTRFYHVLDRIDADLAMTARRARCGQCGGVLHSARFPRKPRSAPADLPAGYSRRYSFCCARDGCRSRVTPPSVRFLGRRVYLGAVVVVVSALQSGTTPWRAEHLRALLGVGAKTLARWRTWWRETFVETPLWKAARSRFATPVAEAGLPGSLLERFAGDGAAQVTAVLRFVSPLTASGNCTLAEGRR